MQIRIFRIPVEGCPSMEADLNAFLRSHRVLKVERELVQRELSPGWAFCIEYLESAGGVSTTGGRSKSSATKVDYREVLSAEDFAIFSQLRAIRKSLAEAEGVPVYAVLTNEQLAEISKARPSTKAALGAIDGIGESRVEKYGEALLKELGANNKAELESPSP